MRPRCGRLPFRVLSQWASNQRSTQWSFSSLSHSQRTLHRTHVLYVYIGIILGELGRIEMLLAMFWLFIWRFWSLFCVFFPLFVSFLSLFSLFFLLFCLFFPSFYIIFKPILLIFLIRICLIGLLLASLPKAQVCHVTSARFSSLFSSASVTAHQVRLLLFKSDHIVLFFWLFWFVFLSFLSSFCLFPSFFSLFTLFFVLFLSFCYFFPSFSFFFALLPFSFLPSLSLSPF